MKSILTTTHFTNQADTSSNKEEESKPLYPAPSHIERTKLDRSFAALGMFLMAFTSIVACALVVNSNHKTLFNPELNTPPFPHTAKKEAPWHQDWSANLDDISIRCTRLINKDRSIVVFSHGTCVMIEEPVNDRQATAKHILLIAADPESKFKSNRISNKDHIITFSPSVFTWITAKDIATHKNSLLSKWDQGLSEDERNNLFGRKVPLSTQVGILARSKLLEDASSPKVVKVIIAKQTMEEQSSHSQQLSSNSPPPSDRKSAPN